MNSKTARLREHLTSVNSIVEGAQPVYDWLRQRITDGVLGSLQRASERIDATVRTQWVVEAVGLGVGLFAMTSEGQISRVIEIILLSYGALQICSKLLHRLVDEDAVGAKITLAN